ncbi:hypothetical protein DFP72DRAFT_1074378 [Ephemerocybe angulata]|uniref:Uncharacterized protein n=1 Tax=Ephemerocybe angulata TaxID=980116 RepID=A0A8H6HM99_9AGAR|nr:hypothetical protein DFP72DRAFT_1074378 [Tulosesus angulatus]
MDTQASNTKVDFRSDTTNIIVNMPHSIVYQYVRMYIQQHAGPPPPSDHQDHQFIDIRLDLGEFALANMGRYSGKCVNPEHRDRSQYPRCHRVRMITPPLSPESFDSLRQRVVTYTRITNKFWGFAQNPMTAVPHQVTDVDLESSTVETLITKNINGDEGARKAREKAEAKGYTWLGLIEIE